MPRKIKSLSASFTLEAAMIMPIVFFVIFAIISLTFCLYDQCRIQGITDIVLHKAAFAMKHEAEIATGKVSYDRLNDRDIFYLPFGSTKEPEESIRLYLLGELNDNLLITDLSDAVVSVGRFGISVTVEGRLRIPIRGIRDFLPGDPGITVKAEASFHNPAETIRISEVVLETGTKIKGIEALKEGLGNLLP